MSTAQPPFEMSAWTGNGIRTGATRTDGERTEVLWSNRPLTVDEHLFSSDSPAGAPA